MLAAGHRTRRTRPASSVCAERLDGERLGLLSQFVTNPLKERLGGQDAEPSPGPTVHLLYTPQTARGTRAAAARRARRGAQGSPGMGEQGRRSGGRAV